jgi:hypothetical protein
MMRVPIPLWRCRRVDANPPRILVIANRTASTPIMLDMIAERAEGGASFTLLIPPDHGHQDDWSQELALELVGRATGGDVASLDSGNDPLDTSTARSPTASSTS